MQQDVFESEGVDLGRVIIGHSGDTDDLDYLTTMMNRGSYIGMDRFGDDMRLSTEKRVDTVVRLCAMGYAHQIVLSHDAACYQDWFTREWSAANRPNRVFTYLPDVIIPALQEAGLPQAQIHTMTVENPRAIFEREGAY
jgi:phosphotriesterase-related protein